MAFTPNPNLFNQSFGGGLQNAKSLLGIIQQKKDRSKLQEIASMLESGDFQDAGSALVGLNKVGAGLQTLNVPYAREQDTLKSQFDREKFGALQKSRLDQLNKPTSAIQNFNYGQKNPAFANYQARLKRAGSTNITNNMGQSNEFRKELDKKAATFFTDLSSGGYKSKAKILQVDRLENLMSKFDTGAGAVFKQAAGQLGINSEGLSEIQAAEALISKLVPESRQAGSGPMSDADLELFKLTWPSLINQPGGNRLIMETIRGIAEYDVLQGEIADKVISGEYTQDQGRDALRQLENPLNAFKKTSNSNDENQNNDTPPIGITVEEWGHMSPQEKELFNE